MQLEMLREFVELSNCMNFTKAAQRLFISQSALSTHISDLEKSVGVTLVSRGRPLRLTAAGRLFYENANRILTIYDETIEGCKARAEASEKGQLFIKTDYAHEDMMAVFRRLVTEFKKQYPSVDVSIVSEQTGNLLEGLTDGSITCGFIGSTFDNYLEKMTQNAQIKTLLVQKGSVTLWMRPTHPLAHKERLSIHDLNGLNYPLPIGEQFAELRVAALELVDAYHIKPVYRNMLVDTFADYLFGIEDNDVFLFFEQPHDQRMNRLICRSFEPNIEHRIFCAVSVDEANPASQLFFDYMQDHISAFECELNEG